MTRIVDGPLLTGEVFDKQGAPLAGVTVTVSSTVYTDRELSTGATTSLVTNGSGVFSAFAPPGTYTFTTTAASAAPIESVEVLSRDEGGGNTSLIKRLSGSFLLVGGSQSTGPQSFLAPTGLPTAAPQVRFGNVIRGRHRTTVDSDGAYNAFPDVVQLSNGTLLTGYRKGTTHAADIGHLVTATSTDLGKTWSAPVTVLTDATLDCRGVRLAKIGSTYYLTGFYYDTAGLQHAGVFVLTSPDGATWTQRTVVARNTYAASQSRVRAAPNGDLLLPIYRNNNAASLLRSTDGGVTWGAEVALSAADGKTYSEVCMDYLPGTTTLMALIRQDTDHLFYKTTSTDGGVTWAAPASIGITATGYPSWISLTTGPLILCFRRQAGTQVAQYTTSYDNGATWQTVALQDTTPAASASVYHGMIEVGRGLVCCVYALEANGSTQPASIYCRYFLDGRGVTPLGDSVMDTPALRTALRTDDIVAFDYFQRADETDLSVSDSGHQWVNYLGGATHLGVTSRRAVVGTPVALFGMDTGVADGEVEAEIYWPDSTHTGPGVAFRMIDGQNLLYVSIESSNSIFLKKYVANVQTQLQTVALTNTPVGGLYYPLKVSYRKNQITVTFNGIQVADWMLAGADQTTFGAATVAGVRLTQANHKCRSILVRQAA